MQLPLRLTLKPSAYLTALLALLYLAVLGSVITLDLAFWPKLVAACMVSLFAVLSLRGEVLLLSPNAVREIILQADGAIEAGNRGGGRLTVAVSQQSIVFSWLVVLLLKVPARRRLLSVVILPDSLTTDDFRALCIWLRWKAKEEASGA